MNADPAIRTAAITAALVSVVLGVLGLVHGSGQKLMGLFAVSTLDNLLRADPYRPERLAGW